MSYLLNSMNHHNSTFQPTGMLVEAASHPAPHSVYLRNSTCADVQVVVAIAHAASFGDIIRLFSLSPCTQPLTLGELTCSLMPRGVEGQAAPAGCSVWLRCVPGSFLSSCLLLRLPLSFFLVPSLSFFFFLPPPLLTFSSSLQLHSHYRPSSDSAGLMSFFIVSNALLNESIFGTPLIKTISRHFSNLACTGSVACVIYYFCHCLTSCLPPDLLHVLYYFLPASI